MRCCWPTASRPALSADLAFRRYSASASPHFDDFVCFFERGVPPSWQRLWRHNRCVNRRGAERAFCDRRKRDLRQFDLRHVAPRQWFFRRCSLACSGRASARVCARLGGCRGQLAHTARSAARCIYPRGSQSVRKQKQQRRFRAVKRAIAERTTPAFYAKRLTASARPLDTFAANVPGLEVGFVLRARAPARRRRCRSSERASAAHLRPLFARSMSSALARCR